MTKEAIRSEVRKKRRAVSGIHVMEMSLRICEKIVALPEYQNARRVMCYSSMPEEVQTRGLLWAIQSSGRELCLPVWRDDKSMDAVLMTEDTRLVPDRMGIDTPLNGEIVPPSSLDLVLVPGVAFDKKGNRLGYGQGDFDRYLSRCSCPAVGLAYELQVVEDIHPADHDVPMNRVVTEKNVYTCAPHPAQQNNGE